MMEITKTQHDCGGLGLRRVLPQSGAAQKQDKHNGDPVVHTAILLENIDEGRILPTTSPE
jgi:hypothetical protein